MKYRPVVLGVMLASCSAPRTGMKQETESTSASSVLPPLPVPTAKVVVTTGCAEDMVFVEGDYCLRVEQKCLRWLDTDLSSGSNFGIGPLRCAEFDITVKCIDNKREHKRFCIDKFEWPNKFGELPPVGMDWDTAKKSCSGVGKRLCTASEWTFACEGEESKPYPYGDGYHRDSTACNIDREPMRADTPRSEWSNHYKAVPSGSMPKCKSPFGVYDLTGNVDEWVFNVGGKTDGDPYYSGLKGGYWGPVRTRCRPMTTIHGPKHSFYQNGFRCCSAAKENKAF